MESTVEDTEIGAYVEDAGVSENSRVLLLCRFKVLTADGLFGEGNERLYGALEMVTAVGVAAGGTGNLVELTDVGDALAQSGEEVPNGKDEGAPGDGDANEGEKGPQPHDGFRHEDKREL